MLPSSLLPAAARYQLRSPSTRRLAQCTKHLIPASNTSSVAPLSTSRTIMAPIAVVAGVGPGTGGAIAKRFAKKYPVVLLARKPETYEPLAAEITKAGGKAFGIATDCTSPESVSAAFSKIKAEFGGGGGSSPNLEIAAAVFNLSGGFARKPFLELTLEEFDNGYTTNGHAAFLFSQAVLPHLQAYASPDQTAAQLAAQGQHPPTLIFTGATASTKGSANFASFAHGKFALRALAQSLAREFGPKGVHVAHAIIDGVIDIPRTKEWDMGKGPDAKIDPEAIAESYWYLHTQPRTSFTFEIDMRPFVEKW